MWCNWFTRHSDKVEFVGSSPIISTKMKIAGSNPTSGTIQHSIAVALLILCVIVKNLKQRTCLL